MWTKILRRLKLAPLSELRESQQKAREFELKCKHLLEAQNAADIPCCETHATPAQLAMHRDKIVCPECGERDCNKAVICNLPCSNQERRASSAFV